MRIYREEGPKAFYRGMLPSLFGVAHVAVQFPLYEQFKSFYRESNSTFHPPQGQHLIRSSCSLTGPEDGSDIPSSTILFCSSVSKMIASVATYPHEVLRTRLQIQKNHQQQQGKTRTPPAASVSSSIRPSKTKAIIFEGLLPTFRRILHEEGVKGFYRGMGVNLLRTVPSSAVTLLVYEKIMQSLLRRTHPEDYDEEGRKLKQ